MSVLTKLFVVLVTILAVMLVSLIVPFVANVENYREQRDQAVVAMKAAKQAADVAQAETSALQNKESETMGALKAEKQLLIGDINSLKNQLASSEALEKARAAELAARTADLNKLSSANQQMSDLLKNVETELVQRRDENVKQQTKIIQLADANNELESKLETVSRQVRYQREEMVALEEKVGEYEEMFRKLDPDTLQVIKGGEVVEGGGRPFEPNFAIYGQVLRVEHIGDETFVEINVGKKDKVAANMTFRVHRGTQFLGRLIITNVDDATSAGRISLPQGTEITAGDGVQTGTVNIPTGAAAR